MKLEDWRKEIDEVDSEIVRLLAQRTRIAKKIGKLKAKAGISVIDPKREEEILKVACLNASADINDSSILNIYGRILQESRLIQVEVSKNVRKEKVGIY